MLMMNFNYPQTILLPYVIKLRGNERPLSGPEN